jgi:hypothetical protein
MNQQLDAPSLFSLRLQNDLEARHGGRGQVHSPELRLDAVGARVDVVQIVDQDVAVSDDQRHDS